MKYLFTSKILEGVEIKTGKKSATISVAEHLPKIRKMLVPHIGKRIKLWYEIKED